MIINESNTEYLYHCTKPRNAISILKSDELSTINPYNYYDFRSFTRSKSNALNSTGKYGGIIFVVDQEKLRNNYKIIPRGDDYKIRGNYNTKVTRRHDDTKAEEVVPGIIKDFSKYVVEIWSKEKYNKELDDAAKSRGFNIKWIN